MAILVTGAAGYIGSHMLLALGDAGKEVVALDNLSTGCANAIPSGVPFVQGDIGDDAKVARAIREYRIETVIHFAASTVVSESVEFPSAYYTNNTVKVLDLLRTCTREGVEKFILSSTAAVYADTSEPVDEQSPVAPQSPYGASKLMAERILSDLAATSGLRHAVLRYFNVAGADPALRAGQSTSRATHLIKACARAAAGGGGEINVFGTDYPTPDGTGVRDYIHVSDLVDAHTLVLAALSKHRRLLYNCGYGRGYSVREVIEATRRISGVAIRAIDQPRRAGDAAAVVANADKIRRELGWEPRFAELDVIVQHALAWELKSNAALG